MLEIKNKIEFEGCWVGEVNSSTFNSSKQNRIKAVTDISSICFGRLGFNEEDNVIEYGFPPAVEQTKNKRIWDRRLNLYNRLLKESAGNPSTPYEFIPVRIELNHPIFNKLDFYSHQNKVLKYSYIIPIEGIATILTNMRTLLKAGIKEEDIPFNTPEEVEGFKVIIGKFPKTAFDHIIRSRSLSPNAESSRNKKYLNEVEFHYPEYWDKELVELYKSKDNVRVQSQLAHIQDKDIKPEDATKELSCRRLMLSVWGGWKNDPNTWDNLFNTRAKGSGTQEITGKVVDNIKELIYGRKG